MPHASRSALATVRTLAALAVAVGPVGAQINAGAGVGAFLERQSGGWQSVTRFEPSVRLDNRWTQLTADLSAGASSNTARADRSAFSFLIQPAPLGAFRLTTHIEGERTKLGDLSRATASIESALSLAGTNGGVWIGARQERDDRHLLETTPFLSAGIWRRLANIDLTLSTQPHQIRFLKQSTKPKPEQFLDSTWNDTSRVWNYWWRNRTGEAIPADSTRLDGAWRWTDIQARLGWSNARFAIDASAGYRPRVGDMSATSWGRVTAIAALAPRVSLVASGGADPSRLWVGSPGARFLSLGLRVAPASLVRAVPVAPVRPAAAAFEIERSDSLYIVSIRVPQARTVELSGDFSGWKPVVLRQVRPDVWEAAFSLAPGAHRVNLRVNGDRWTAPPGLATVDDEFNGKVGLLVVR